MNHTDNLKGKIILIGKESGNGRLLVSVKINGQPKTTAIGEVNSVPNSVSRCKPTENTAHCKIEVDTIGNLIVTNLKPQNVTYVNGAEIVSKKVKEDCIIELGKDHFSIKVSTIIEIASKIVAYHSPQNTSHESKVETADIRPLKNIWTEYDNQSIETKIAERKFNAARSATGIITMLAIVCSLTLGHGPIYLILYALAIGISVAFTYMAYRKSTEVPQRERDLKKQFQQRYVCPKCGHFMGFQDYDILIQNEACPYCKTKFKK